MSVSAFDEAVEPDDEIQYSGRDADTTCQFGEDTWRPSAPLKRRGITSVELAITIDEPGPALKANSIPRSRFDEFVELQRASDEAHTAVEQLRDEYGPPAARPWTEVQTETYETAWRVWRDLARDVQAAITEYAGDESKSRYDVEAAVKKRARHSDPSTANQTVIS